MWQVSEGPYLPPHALGSCAPSSLYPAPAWGCPCSSSPIPLRPGDLLQEHLWHVPEHQWWQGRRGGRNPTCQPEGW